MPGTNRRSARPVPAFLTPALLFVSTCADPPPPVALPEATAGEPPASSPGGARPLLLWTYDDDLNLPGFAAAARSLGVTGMQHPSYRDPGPWHAQGFQWYEDHAAGKGTLGLRDTEWPERRERAWDARFEAWPAEPVRARPRCLRDPKWTAEMSATLAKVLPRAAGASFIVIEDEPSAAVRINPLDWCLCDRCVLAFRAWIRLRWQDDLTALNRAWGTSYPAWADVRPWTTSAIRARELEKDPGDWNLAPWIETRDFQDVTFAEAVRTLTDQARAALPSVPVGLAGLQAPSAFGGYDYGTLLPGMTFAEPYDLGLALPVCRDLGAPGMVLAQTLFPDDDLRVFRWRLWRGVARGATAEIVWSSRDALRHDPGAKTWTTTPYGRALAAEAKVLTGGLGGVLAAARPIDDGIAVVLSQPSIQVRWMLDSAPDGPAWMNRTGSYEVSVSTAIRSRTAAWRELAGRAPRFVDASGVASLPPHTVVVAPDLVAADAALRDELAKRAAAGASVLCDIAPTAFDELGRARKPGIAGVAVLDGWKGLAARAEKAAGPPILRVTAVRDDGGDAPPIEVGYRRADDGTTYAVCVAMWDAVGKDDGSAAVELPKTRLALTFEFGDGKARVVRDAVSGRTVTGADGSARWTGARAADEPAVWTWR